MTNLEMLSLASRGLDTLKDEVVFVGGATIELYLTGQPALKIRPTDDVDCVIEIASQLEYHKLEERLRGLGFKNVREPNTPICRWEYKGILVDVMPIQGGILGFANRWYPEGFEKAITAILPDGQTLRIFDLPYLVASKIEAFRGRGQNDFMGSSDMEDIVTVIDGVADFKDRISQASEAVRMYLQESFAGLLANDRFLDSLEGHLPSIGRRERVERALEILRTLGAAKG